MATPEQIASLRNLIGEAAEAESGYTDEQLDARIDARNGNLDLVAYDIWMEKAAKHADLVDVTEGGSTRKLGDLHEQALSMVKSFAERVNSPVIPPDPNPSGVTIRRLTRP